MGPPHGCEPQSPALPQASAGFERVCPPVFQNALGAAPAGTPGPVLGFSRHRRHTISPLPQASARRRGGDPLGGGAGRSSRRGPGAPHRSPRARGRGGATPVPAPGAEPRSEPAEPEARGNPPGSRFPAPAHPLSGRPHPNPSLRPPPSRPSLQASGTGAPARVQVRPHLPARAAMARGDAPQDRRVGGRAGAAQTRPVGLKADGMGLQCPPAASLCRLSRRDGACSPLPGAGGLGGGRGGRGGASSG